MNQLLFKMNNLHCVNIEYSINSGQVFLWKKENKKWYGINGSDILAINEKPYQITSYTKKPMDVFREGDDSKKIFQSITKDKVVKSAVKLFPGLRLLRQDPFQCYISFIASSNSSIQNIRHMLQLLCKKFGTKVKFEGRDFSLFPEPRQLAKAEKKDLLDCGLGYRVKSIKKASNAVISGEIDFDFLKNVDYDTAKESLVKVFGVGNKVADCIMLFSLEKLDAFPIDRWMLRVLQKYYSKKFQISGKTLTEKKYEKLHEEIINHFGPFAGYSQQFLFKMMRDLNQKKWL